MQEKVTKKKISFQEIKKKMQSGEQMKPSEQSQEDEFEIEFEDEQ